MNLWQSRVDTLKNSNIMTCRYLQLVCVCVYLWIYTTYKVERYNRSRLGDKLLLLIYLIFLLLLPPSTTISRQCTHTHACVIYKYIFMCVCVCVFYTYCVHCCRRRRSCRRRLFIRNRKSITNKHTRRFVNFDVCAQQ